MSVIHGTCREWQKWEYIPTLCGVTYSPGSPHHVAQAVHLTIDSVKQITCKNCQKTADYKHQEKLYNVRLGNMQAGTIRDDRFAYCFPCNVDVVSAARSSSLCTICGTQMMVGYRKRYRVSTKN